METNYRGEQVMSNKYERELATLKPWDEVQFTETVKGLPFIVTAGHGYLVVPKTHKAHAKARAMCVYGYKGHHAVYLEEDCEAYAFINECLDNEEPQV